MTIRPYAPQDRQKLCDLFAELIENHKEYISHGELQMGIATDRGELAPDFRNAWLRYLDRQGVADCYLESGVDNHSAHRFFEKFGFGQVSCIFRAKL